MNIKFVTSIKEFPAIQNSIAKSQQISFDIETTGLDFIEDEILLLQLATYDYVYVIDCRKLRVEELAYIVRLLEVSDALMIAHNAKFDMKFLAYKTKVMLHSVYCTMLGEAMINGGTNPYESLSNLLGKYLGITINKEVRDTFIDYEGEITEEQIEYGADDVFHLKQLYDLQHEILSKEKMLNVLYEETRLLPVVTAMEVTGISLDKDAWSDIIKNNEKSFIEIDQKIKEFLWDILVKKFKDVPLLEVLDSLYVPVKTKRDRNAFTGIKVHEGSNIFYKWFNVNSFKQLLGTFKILDIPLKSTGEKVISNYKLYSTKNKTHIQYIDMILEFREFSKKVSSYGEKFINMINSATGKIHADFNQIGTRTGRFSSSNPNLQQIPAELEYREAFIATEGYFLVTVDYSQQEYRLAGDVSGERNIIDAYLADIDMHTFTASFVYDIPIEDVTKEQRFMGKTINFAILYGTSEYGLSKNLKITVEEAKKLIDMFHSNYPILSAFIGEVHKLVLQNYYSVTPLGRRRYFERKTIYNDPKEYHRYMGMLKREGFNHVIQGGSADMLKVAMNKVYYDNPFGYKLLRTLLAVHDEIVVEVHESIINEGVEFIIKCMEDAGAYFQTHIPAKSGKIISRSWSK